MNTKHLKSITAASLLSCALLLTIAPVFAQEIDPTKVRTALEQAASALPSNYQTRAIKQLNSATDLQLIDYAQKVNNGTISRSEVYDMLGLSTVERIAAGVAISDADFKQMVSNAATYIADESGDPGANTSAGNTTSGSADQGSGSTGNVVPGKCPANAPGCTNLIVPIPGIGATVTDPVQYIIGVYNFALSVGGLIAMFLIVLAGIQRVSSAGNPSKIADANDRIINALWGMGLLFGAFIILNTINPELTSLKALQTPAIPKFQGNLADIGKSYAAQLEAITEATAEANRVLAATVIKLDKQEVEARKRLASAKDPLESLRAQSDLDEIAILKLEADIPRTRLLQEQQRTEGDKLRDDLRDTNCFFSPTVCGDLKNAIKLNDQEEELLYNSLGEKEIKLDELRDKALLTRSAIIELEGNGTP